MKIWAHTLVQNEERYIWYAVMSVIEYVDKILIWDTGSEDGTRKIIKEIKRLRKDKVEVNLLGRVNPDKFTEVRQEMLNETKSDWFILVDGDEVWWDSAIKEIVNTVYKEGKTLETIVTRSYLPVGDIFHYQEEAAGMYEIDGVRGHLTIRAMSRKIPGLRLKRPHGTQGFYDENDILIQERPKKYRKFLDVYNMHFTHLPRSSSKEFDRKVPKRSFKLKYELGIPFPSDFYYPEVFFNPRPKIVPSLWRKMEMPFFLKASVFTPLRKIKRRIVKSPSGY